MLGRHQRNTGKFKLDENDQNKRYRWGQETLLIGGTGTTGCNGRGARIYRRDGDQVWTPIVDVLVDENTSGTNENGFGYDSGRTTFFYSAFQAWSWVEYDDTLLVGVAKLEGGGMIYSTPDAAEADGAWAFSMGGPGADRLKDRIPGFTGIADSSVLILLLTALVMCSIPGCIFTIITIPFMRERW